MPKRSNDFQRSVKRIYDQLAPTGAKVVESASLPDYGEVAGPEIDVLVEFEVAGAARPMRIAIECRDNARRADKTWIDGIIGKYRDVEVDRIIAVSRSDFTSGALRKAKQGKIELRTLRDALETDWPKELMLIAVGRIEYHPEIGFVQFDARPPWPNTSEPLAVRVGQKWIDQNEFKLWLSRQIVARFSAEVDRERARGSQRLDEFGTHPITVMIESDELWFRSHLGVDHHVRRIVMNSSVTITETMLPVTRYRFGDVG